jgi:hypothetical protein
MPSGLDLLGEEEVGSGMSGLNLLEEPETIPIPKKPISKNPELRSYFESGSPPWMIPNFGSLPLSELNTPAPPGGWDVEGNPLDETGTAYGKVKLPEKYTTKPGIYNEPKRNFIQKVGDEVHRLFTDPAEEKAKATYSIVMAEQLGVRPSDISPDLYTAFMSGLGGSVHGLIGQTKSGKKYPSINPKAMEAQSTVTKFAQMAGGLVGDLPTMTAAGVSTSLVASPLTGFIAAFTVPAGLRAHYAYELEHGKINTPEEYIEDIKGVAKESVKGAVTGMATGAAGKAVSALGAIPRLGTEAAVMSTVGAGLEGKLPTKEDIAGAALFMVGMHGIGKVPDVSSRVKNFWVKTGRAPQDLIQDAQTDPKLAEWLVKGGNIPEDVLERAQTKVKETSDIQTELAAKAEAERISKIDINKLIMDELMVKAEKIDKVKEVREEAPVEPEEVPKSGIDLLDGVRSNFEQSYKSQAEELGVKFNGMQEGVGTSAPIFTDPETGSSFSIRAGEKVSDGLNAVRDRFKKEEPFDEVDEEIGIPLPKGLSTEKHPLRETDIEHTNTMSKIFKEQLPKTSSPETFTRYLINEVNRYLNGEEVQIDQVRNGLSDLAARASEVEERFDNPLYYLQWKKTVSEAARWARNADRSNIERIGGTTLNMGVDPTQIAPFFSKMKKLVEEKMGGRASIGELKNMLEKNGVTQDELNNTGILSELKETPVKKQDVLDAIEANSVKLEDVVLGGRTEPIDEGILSGTSLSVTDTQFSTYQLPGGKEGSYREMFVTAPDYLQNVKGQYGNDVTEWPKDISEWQDGHSQYSSIQNPVVRVRFNEREVDGKKILFIEEMQGPSGDTKYYIGDNVFDQKPKAIEYAKNNDLSPENITKTIEGEQSKMPAYLQSRIYDIGVKRILAYAKEKGFDGVAWTPGEIQANRYSLEKHFSKIEFRDNYSGGISNADIEGPPSYGRLIGYDHNKQVIVDEYLEAEQLHEYIGKEHTEKLLNTSAELTHSAGTGVRQRTLSGIDLKHTKGNLKDVYDKTIPSMMKKYGKENVEKIPIDITDSGWGDTTKRKMADVQMIPITEKVPGSFSLYTGVDPIEGGKAIIDAAKRAKKYVENARSMKEFKPGVAFEKVKEEVIQSVVDRSGNIRRDMLSDLGDEGYRILQSMYLSKGASARSAEMLKQMRKEVYSGLTKQERRVLDTLILMKRMLDIGGYKTTNQFNFPKGASPIEAAAYTELYQYIEGVTREQAINLRNKMDAYYEWMRKPVKDLFDAGLIKQEEHDALIAHNYRRLKLVEVYDKRHVSKVGATKRTIYDSGVEALSHGRDTDIFEPSSEIMALEVFNRAYGRIMNNEANSALLKLARDHGDNNFVRVKEDRGTKIPSGWNRIFVYENGERKALFISPQMSREWITNSPEVSYKLGQVFRYGSGSPILRTFATGINWGFALANLPRDIMHSWYATRVFEDGKWKSLYSNSLPTFALQMGRDQASVFSDALLRKGRYKDYINEGGGMEFLVHQGRLLQRGRHIEGGLDKVMDFLGYFGETSEIMTRLAIRERALRKGKGSKEATFVARDYMDFAQGGGVTKALDNAIPYLNASVQGTRGMLRAFKDSPIDSAIKMSQFAALVTGMYIASNKYNPQTMQSLQGSIDQQNNICIPIGDQFSYLDSKGQTRYPYIKIPLDPGQKFFKTLFEGATDKWLGNEVDVERITGSLKNMSPVGISSLPPTLSGVLGYVQNKNYWLNEEIWNSNKYGGPYGFPQSGEEFIPGKTPQAMVDLGKVTGLSPERTKYAIEQLITKDNIFTTLGGGLYEKVYGEVPKVEKEMILAEALSKSPGVKRFIGSTNPYSQFAGPIKEGMEKAELERFIQNRGLDARFEGYLADKVDRQEIFEYMQSFKDRDVYNRLKDRFKFAEKIKELPNRAFWLSLKGIEDTETRARLYLDRLDKASPEEQDRIMTEEIPIVLRAGGIISGEFRKEVIKLRSE